MSEVSIKVLFVKRLNKDDLPTPHSPQSITLNSGTAVEAIRPSYELKISCQLNTALNFRHQDLNQANQLPFLVKVKPPLQNNKMQIVVAKQI
jgi:hypothetical protein